MFVEIVPIDQEKPKPLSVAAILKDKNKKVLANYSLNPFYMPAQGITIDDTTADGKEVLKLIENSVELRPYFFPATDSFGNEVRGKAQLFKIQNLEQDAKEAIDSFDKAFDVMTKIKGMGDREVSLFGKLVGASGSANIVRAELAKMLQAGPKQMQNIIQKLEDPDREYLEVIYFQLDKAMYEADQSKGLRKTSGNVYSLNGEVVGAGEEALIAYLKENDNLFASLKKEAVKTK